MSNETAAVDTNESPNKVVEQANDSGIVVAYKCQYHIKTGGITQNNGKEINSFYEMIHPCREDPEDAMHIVASELLDALGTTFGLLPDGSACTIPDTSLDTWVIGESSAPLDSIVSHMDCLSLSTGDNAELCCSVVKAPMTFWVTRSNFKDQDVMKYVAAELNAGAFTYQTAYIGSKIEYTGNAGYDQQPAPDFPDDDPVVSEIASNPSDEKKQSLTLMGGFLVAALVVVVVFGIAVVSFRRRRHARRLALDKENEERDSLEFIKEIDSMDPTIEVDDMIDKMLRQQAMSTTGSVGLDDEKVDEGDYPRNYTFDIADSMKHHIMGQYGSSSGRGTFGRASMAAYPPPYAMEETSDSEADSWAQTEGTVGSLEENLEQITAEI